MKRAQLRDWSNIILTLNYFASSLTRQLHPTQFVISLSNKYWKQQTNQRVCKQSFGPAAGDKGGEGQGHLDLAPHGSRRSDEPARKCHIGFHHQFQSTGARGDFDTKLLVLYYKGTERPLLRSLAGDPA